MDLIMGLLGSLFQIGFLFVVIGGIAALFMILFGIATGIDNRIHN